jgi:hypothetical protein
VAKYVRSEARNANGVAYGIEAPLYRFCTPIFIIKRFPEDFMFQLTNEEMEYWKSQIVMTNSINMGVRRKPYVFTELGVAMLSSVLNSGTARLNEFYNTGYIIRPREENFPHNIYVI